MTSRVLRTAAALAMIVTVGAAPGNRPAAAAPSPVAAAPSPVATVAEVAERHWLADRLERSVVDGGRRHLVAWQRAADRGGGTRAAGTPGFAASADYLVDTLTRAGYQVVRQDVPYRDYRIDVERADIVAPTPGPLRVLVARGSPVTPAGGVVAPVVTLPADTSPANAGCAPTDYGDRPVAGAVVVIPRGSCGLVAQQRVAAGLGAVAMLTYQVTPRPDNVYRLHLFRPSDVTIPIASIPQRDVARLTDRTTIRLELRGEGFDAVTENILAEIGDDPDAPVVMAGAHLDSVIDTPGLNDNASSAAALLETAVRIAPYRHHLPNRVRFAWWGAEELIVVGSTYYVSRLDDAERRAIALYLNAELIASPNFARFVMDGDDSDHPDVGVGPGPPGSGAVEAVLSGWYRSRGLAFETIDISGIGSDHEPFGAAGIPIGGVDGGTTGIKTPEQARRYGGVAGQMYDSCYHQPCDDLGNINQPEQRRNTKLLAWTIGRFAMTVDDITLRRDLRPLLVTESDRFGHHETTVAADGALRVRAVAGHWPTDG